MRMLTRLARAGTLIWGVLLMAACGDGQQIHGPEDTPTVVASVIVEGGDSQKAPPEVVFPDSIVGRALDGNGNPVEGRLVNFEVPAGSEAGTFDAGALTTNAQGRVFNQLEAGTRAWTARMAAGEDSAYEARLVASREGRPDEIASFTFAVEPDPAAEVSGPGSAREGTSPLMVGVVATDQHGNPALFRAEVDSVFTVLDTTYGHPDARTLRADREGEAVVCIRSPDSLLAVGKAISWGDRMRFEIHGADDPNNEHSEVQLEDCR